MSHLSVEEIMLVTEDQEGTFWNWPSKKGCVPGRGREAEPVGKDGSAEKPFREETQNHVHVEACKSRQ